MATENIAQVHEKVKDLPDEILVQLAQKGAGIDSTLAVAELDARNMMRQQSALQPPGPMGTVADEVIAESQMMQPGLTSVMPPIDANPMLAQGISSPMGAMAPPMDAMAPPMDAMAPPMGMMDAGVAGLPVDDTMYAAEGGIVGFQEGGDLGFFDYLGQGKLIGSGGEGAFQYDKPSHWAGLAAYGIPVAGLGALGLRGAYGLSKLGIQALLKGDRLRRLGAYAQKGEGIGGRLAQMAGLGAREASRAKTLKKLPKVKKAYLPVEGRWGQATLGPNPKELQRLQRLIGKRAAIRGGLGGLTAAGLIAQPFLSEGKNKKKKKEKDEAIPDYSGLKLGPVPEEPPKAKPPMLGRRFWDTIARAGIYGAADTQAPTFLTGLTGGLKQATEENLVLRKQEEEQLAALRLQQLKSEAEAQKVFQKALYEEPGKVRGDKVSYFKTVVPKIKESIEYGTDPDELEWLAQQATKEAGRRVSVEEFIEEEVLRIAQSQWEGLGLDAGISSVSPSLSPREELAGLGWDMDKILELPPAERNRFLETQGLQ